MRVYILEYLFIISLVLLEYIFTESEAIFFKFQTRTLKKEEVISGLKIGTFNYKRDFNEVAILLNTSGFVSLPHENLTTLCASISDAPIDEITWLGV